MKRMIENFPNQLKEALEIGEKAIINKGNYDIQNVVILGMGGSALAGDFVRDFVSKEAKVPVIVSKGYLAPGFIGKNSLVIITSYSGNTEETLRAYEGIQDSEAKIVCITSGGKLQEIAKDNNYDLIVLPNENSSARACLGYSIVEQLYVMVKFGLIKEHYIKSVRTAIDIIKFNMDEIQILANKIAKKIHTKTTIVYTTTAYQSVALRLKQQINENDKMHSWVGIVPEMNHNELAAWNNEKKETAVVYFRPKVEIDRNTLRIDINKKIISPYCDTIIDIFAKGKTQVEQALYFVHVGDWISYYIAQLNNIDSTDVKAIKYLKTELAKSK